MGPALASRPELTHLNRPTGLGGLVREVQSGCASSGTQVRKGQVRGHGYRRAGCADTGSEGSGAGEQVRAGQFKDAGSRRSARAIRFRTFGPSGPAQADPTPPTRTRSPNPTPSPT